MNTLDEIKVLLQQNIKGDAEIKAIFFKTKPGEYAEHDRFIGVSVPSLRKIAKQFRLLALSDVQQLMKSPFNEERLLALLILVNQYQKGNETIKNEIYQFYLSNLKYINNWNLVDASAHLIVGAHLLSSNKQILLTLATSKILWERRIAMVATWYFIRQQEFEWTIKIAELLLNDPHDLIHKATGWMLREMGKKDQTLLINFLNQYAHLMPRTMLRYAIEKLTPEERQQYLMRK